MSPRQRISQVRKILSRTSGRMPIGRMSIQRRHMSSVIRVTNITSEQAWERRVRIRKMKKEWLEQESGTTLLEPETQSHASFASPAKKAALSPGRPSSPKSSGRTTPTASFTTRKNFEKGSLIPETTQTPDHIEETPRVYRSTKGLSKDMLARIRQYGSRHDGRAGQSTEKALLKALANSNESRKDWVPNRTQFHPKVQELMRITSERMEGPSSSENTSYREIQVLGWVKEIIDRKLLILPSSSSQFTPQDLAIMVHRISRNVPVQKGFQKANGKDEINVINETIDMNTIDMNNNTIDMNTTIDIFLGQWQQCFIELLATTSSTSHCDSETENNTSTTVEPRDLTSSLYAFGNLEIKPNSEKFLSLWCKLAMDRMKNFNHLEVTNVVYTMQRLNLKNFISEDFLDSLSARISVLYPTMDADLVRTIHRAERGMGMRFLNNIIDQNNTNQNSSSSSRMIPSSRLKSDIVVRSSKGSNQEINPLVVTLMEREKDMPTDGRSHLGSSRHNEQHLVDILNSSLKPLQSILGKLTPSELSIIIHRIGKMLDKMRMFDKRSVGKNEFLEGFLRQWEESVLGMSKMGEPSTSHRAITVTSIMGEKLDSFNAQELSSTLYGFAKIICALIRMDQQKHPSSDFLTQWFRFATAKMEDFNSQNLANCVYSLEKLGFGSTKLEKRQPLPEEFLKALRNRVNLLWDMNPNSGIAGSSEGFSQFGRQTIFFCEKKMGVSLRFNEAVQQLAAKIQLAKINPNASNINSSLGNSFLVEWFENNSLRSYSNAELVLVLNCIGRVWEKIREAEKQTLYKVIRNRWEDVVLANIGKDAFLNQKNAPSTRVTINSSITAGLESFSPKELANSIYVMSKIQYKPSAAFMESWFNQSRTKLTQSSTSGASSTFTPQGLSNSIYALYKLEGDSALGIPILTMKKMQIPTDFLQLWLRSATLQLGSFKEQELTNSIYAIAGLIEASEFLKNKDSEQTLYESTLHIFLNNWYSSAVTRLPTFGAQDLANSIYAIGKLDLEPNDKFLKLWCQQAVKIFLRGGYSRRGQDSDHSSGQDSDHASSGQDSDHSSHQDSDHAFTPQEMTNCIYAFGRLGIKPPAMSPTRISLKDNKDGTYEEQGSFLDLWQAKAILIMNQFSSQGLANSIYAFSRLNEMPVPQFLNVWMQICGEKMGIHSSGGTESVGASNPFTLAENPFTPQELSNIIYALGKLNVYVPNSEIGPIISSEWSYESIFHTFLSNWYRTSTMKMDRFNSQELATSIYGLSKLELRPEPEFLKAWYDQSVKLISAFNPQSLANCIYAFEKLNIPPDKIFLKHWYEESLKNIREFDASKGGVLGSRRVQQEMVEKVMFTTSQIESRGEKTTKDIKEEIKDDNADIVIAFYYASKISLQKKTFTPKELCNCIEGFSKVGFSKVGRTSFENADANLSSFIDDSDNFLRLWFLHFISSVENPFYDDERFDNEDLVKAISSLAAMNRGTQLMSQGCGHRRVTTNVTTNVQSHPEFNRFLKSWVKLSFRTLRRMEMEEIIVVIDSLRHLGQKPNEAFQQHLIKLQRI